MARQHAPVDPKTGDKGLTPAQEAFTTSLAKGESQSDAYRAAFPTSARWKPETVHQKASRLAADGNVKARLAELAQATARTNEFDVSDTFAELVRIVRADAHELVSYRRFGCRYCHGEGHRYQFTPAEFKREKAKHERNRLKNAELAEFDSEGGVGFKRDAEPHPSCPECSGEGEGHVVLGDFKNLSPEGRALLKSVEQTKFGAKVVMHDKLEALEKIARHLDFYTADNKTEVVAAPNNKELDAFFEAALAKARADEALAKARGRQLAGDADS